MDVDEWSVGYTPLSGRLVNRSGSFLDMDTWICIYEYGNNYYESEYEQTTGVLVRSYSIYYYDDNSFHTVEKELTMSSLHQIIESTTEITDEETTTLALPIVSVLLPSALILIAIVRKREH